MSLCGICSESGRQNEPVVWCPECEERLCQTCEDHHRISKASKQHKTIPFENYLELPKLITELKLSCEDHDVVFTHYCEQHERAICSKCLLPDHKECYNVILLDQAVANVKSSVVFNQLEHEMEETIANTYKAENEISSNLESFAKNSIEIDVKLSNICSEIKAHFDKLEKEARSSAVDIKNSHEVKLKSLESEIKTHVRRLLELRESFCKIKEYGNELQLFLGIKEIERQLEGHMKYISDLSSSTSFDKVSIHLLNSMTNLESNFTEICKISKLTTAASLRLSWSDSKAAQAHVDLSDNSDIKTNMFRVKLDYQAAEENELSVTSGDLLMKLPGSPDGALWMLSRKLDFKRDTFFEGLVPVNCVKEVSYLYQFKWFVGNMNSEDRRKIFKWKDNAKGSFLVSGSVNSGKYTLSVKVEGSRGNDILVYSILRTGLLGKVTFSVTTDSGSVVSGNSLEDVIESLKDSSSGLRECLKNPCLQKVEDWGIQREHLEMISTLPGNFGPHCKNFIGRWNRSVPVRIQSFPTETNLPFYKAEAGVLAQCHHPNILKLYGVSSDSDTSYIVTELAAHGMLSLMIKQDDMTFDRVLNFALQVSNGLVYLEERKIIYNDLTINHVWVFEDDVVKIGDFSLAIDGKKQKADKEVGFNIRRTAPEVLLRASRSTKSDVWAFGIFLIELTMGGEGLYLGLKNEEVQKKVIEGYKHPRPKGCPNELYDLALKCWDKDPERRPTFEYLNSFLEDYFKLEMCISNMF